LEDDADLAIQVFQVVLAQVHAVEQDLTFRWIVEPGNELDDGGLALAVLTDQGHPLTGTKLEVQAIKHQARAAGIAEGNIAELEAAHDGARSRQGIRLGANGWLHVEEGQQVGEEQSLIGNAGKGGENLLNVAADLHNGAGQGSEGTDGDGAQQRPPDHVDVGGVVADGADKGENGARDQSAAGERDVLFVNLVPEAGETLGEEVLKAEELQFLG